MKSYFEIEHMFMEMGIDLEKCSDLAWHISMCTAVIELIMFGIIVILCITLTIKIFSIEKTNNIMFIPVWATVIIMLVILFSYGITSVSNWAQAEMINVVIERNGL